MIDDAAIAKCKESATRLICGKALAMRLLLSVVLLVASVAVTAAQSSTAVYTNPTPSPEERAHNLVSRMTLAEKVTTP